MDPQLKSILTGMATAFLIDINAFIASRIKDSNAKYDLFLFAFRALQGALIGALGGHVPL